MNKILVPVSIKKLSSFSYVDVINKIRFFKSNFDWMLKGFILNDFFSLAATFDHLLIGCIVT